MGNRTARTLTPEEASSIDEHEVAALATVADIDQHDARALLLRASYCKRLASLVELVHAGGRWGHEDARDHLRGIRKRFCGSCARDLLSESGDCGAGGCLTLHKKASL